MVSSSQSLTIYTICSALSLAGSIFVCTSFLVIAPLRRTRLYKMVFFMSLSDCGFAIKFFLTSLVGRLYSEEEHDGYCDFQALISQFFGTSSVLWYFFIMLDTFLLLRNPVIKPQFDPSIPWWYHAAVWAYSAMAAIVPLAAGQYGPASDGTCWIHGSHNLFRLLFYIPLTLFLVLGITLLSYASCAMSAWTQLDSRARAHSNSADTLHGFEEDELPFEDDPAESDQEPRQVQYAAPFSCACQGGVLCRMMAFVGVFVLVWVWPCIFRWYQMSTDTSSTPPQLLMVLHQIGVSSAGFANCLVWITHPKLMEFIFDRSCCFGTSFRGSPRTGSLSKRLEPGWIAPHQLDSGLQPYSQQQQQQQQHQQPNREEDSTMSHYFSLDSVENREPCSYLNQSLPPSVPVTEFGRTLDGKSGAL